MFTLILAALFASAYGRFCNPSKFSGMMLNATSGVSFKIAVDYYKNVSYIGDVWRNNYKFGDANTGKLYTFTSESCQVADGFAPPLSRCLPSDAKEIGTNAIGGPGEEMALRTYKYTNALGVDVIDTYSGKRQKAVLFSRAVNGINFVFYNARTDEDVGLHLNPDVSECT